MKHLTKSMIIIAASMAASSAHANFSLNPYVGVDCYHAWTKTKNAFGDIIAQSYPGLAVYIGKKIDENMGFEIGYINAPRTHTVSRRSVIYPIAIVTGQIKVVRHEVYLDWVGFLRPGSDRFELLGSAGIGVVQSNISSAFSPPRSAGAHRAVAFLQSLRGKVGGVLRAGVGIQYMATDQVGLRAKVGWESTSFLRIKGQPNSNGTRRLGTKAYKDSMTMNLGVFLQF